MGSESIVHDRSTRASWAQYTAFGLRITSELKLPELVLSASEAAEDVIIRQADLTAWSDQLEQTNYVIQGERFMLQIPGTAIFAVREGREIEVCPYPGADMDTVRLFLLGSCMGVLLMQRRILPIHGSSVVIGGKAYAFVGESGAGKSTLAAAFRQAGYPMASDDVIAVKAAASGPIVYPAYPQQKLRMSSLLQLESLQGNKHVRPQKHRLVLTSGHPALPQYGELLKLIGEWNKYAVPTVDEFYNEPIPLGGVFELVAEPSSQLPAVTEQPLNVLGCLHTLLLHTYRRGTIARMGLGEWHFETAARMARKVEGWRLLRVSSVFTVSELVERVLDIIHKEENSYGSHECSQGSLPRHVQ
ncbi:serine kinase [Paenibacillus farraposensis]|uniref:Serine kinase n=1 Tax=Paenibacillus farraposensis TaxID=2807095 RepID=A0ABW4DFP0_9BACL|nr:serine kinase [Paenibacillus farraposensis]MCC3382029.1 serine kinase [Paenibacillus farraposensis]